MTGYLESGYAESLSEFGTPRALPLSGGWLLERAIAGSTYRDAMGPYPLFTCKDWSNIESDVEALASDLVSVSMVTDPFGVCDAAMLRRCFPDVMVHFKDHFIADLLIPREEVVSKHHRYYARRSSRELRVEACSDPTLFLDEWSALYQVLIERHEIKGIKRFSRAAFARQLALPGMTMLRALRGETCVGAHLWYLQGDVVYSHLAAFNDDGYKAMAAYALYWAAMDLFRSRARWIDFGAGAGDAQSGSGGLTFFKRGFSNATRPVYFCGRILNRREYDRLVESTGTAGVTYFPAYRNGELT